jgi:hypothetical protein
VVEDQNRNVVKAPGPSMGKADERLRTHSRRSRYS